RHGGGVGRATGRVFQRRKQGNVGETCSGGTTANPAHRYPRHAWVFQDLCSEVGKGNTSPVIVTRRVLLFSYVGAGEAFPAARRTAPTIDSFQQELSPLSGLCPCEQCPPPPGAGRLYPLADPGRGSSRALESAHDSRTSRVNSRKQTWPCAEALKR